MIRIVFETHSWTEEMDRGTATGWLPGGLSAKGRGLAAELGDRRRDVDTVFTSDLARAVETAEIAFGSSSTPILHDWRLRECDYGERNGAPSLELAKREHLDLPYPHGESWREAVDRNARFLADLPTRWAGQRVLVIGHVATRWALDRALTNQTLESLMDADFAWREGWEYQL